MASKTYNIVLPNGKTIHGIPEDVDLEEVAKEAISNGMATKEDFPELFQSENPSDKFMNTLSRMGYGAGDILRGGGQILEKALPESVSNNINALDNELFRLTKGAIGNPYPTHDQFIKEGEKKYKEELAPKEGPDYARLAGQIASNIPLSIAAPAGITGNAIFGALTSALNPVIEGDYEEEKKKQMVTGAGIGGTLGLLGNIYSKVATPSLEKSHDAVLLNKDGIDTTIGQTFGGKVKKFEEWLKRTALFGDPVSKAQNRSIEQFNEEALNKVMEPIRGSIRPPNEGLNSGRNAFSDAYNETADAYANAVEGLKGIDLGKKPISTIGKALESFQKLPSQQKKDFGTAVTRFDKLVSSSDNGQAIKDVLAELNGDIPLYRNSTNSGDKFLGKALSDLRTEIHKTIKTVDPESYAKLRTADETFTGLTRIENAIGRRPGSNTGIYNPSDLASASKSLDTSARKGAFSRGDAVLQDFAERGARVLGKVPKDTNLHIIDVPFVYSPSGQKAISSWLSRKDLSTVEELLKQLLRSGISPTEESFR